MKGYIPKCKSVALLSGLGKRDNEPSFLPFIFCRGRTSDLKNEIRLKLTSLKPQKNTNVRLVEKS